VYTPKRLFFFHVILPIFCGTRGVDVRVLQRYRFPVYILYYNIRWFLASSEAPSAVYHRCRSARTRQHQDDDKRALHAGPPRLYALSVYKLYIRIWYIVYSEPRDWRVTHGVLQKIQKYIIIIIIIFGNKFGPLKKHTSHNTVSFIARTRRRN